MGGLFKPRGFPWAVSSISPSRSPQDSPERKHGEQDASVSGRRKGARWRLRPVWAGALAAAALSAVVVLFVAPVNSWLRWRVGYPVAARVLGRDELLVGGFRVEAGPEPGLTTALAILVILLFLTARVYLAAQGVRRWPSRMRLDSAFVLSLVPYLVLAPLLGTLASAQLFRVPWAFFAVPPLNVILVVGFVLVSLVFAFWVESGGFRHGVKRFLATVVFFLAVGLFWIAMLEGTTATPRFWIALVAVVVALAVYYAMTLGNRIHSHRRALFSLGCFHLAFFGGFLVLWLMQGPWPVQEWSLEGQRALRETRFHPDGPLLAFLALGPAILIAVGAYTIGAFLHRYAAWARVWVDGLTVTVLFAQVLEGWMVMLMVTDPYDALAQTVAAPGPVSAWVVGLLGGWGYFWAKTVLALAVILAVSMPRWFYTGWHSELRAVILGVLLGLGLIPGLRYAMQVTLGV